MNSVPPPAVPSRSLRFERILALIFALLGVTLTALVAAYWFLVLEPTLREHSESRSMAMAQAQAQGIERLLGGDVRLDSLRGELQTTLDAILLLKDQSSQSPFVRRIELVIDYDQVDLPRGSLDMARGVTRCDECFVAQIALYHLRDRQLIGLATFYSSPEFLHRIGSDFRTKLLWGGGAMLCLIGFAWVGTSRLLRRLGESEANLRSVFEAAPIPMVLHRDGQRDLTRVNQAAQDYLGLHEHPAGSFSSESWDVLFASGLPSDAQSNKEMRIPTADGSSRWALVSAVPVRFSGVSSRLVSLVDVSELKAIQDELRSASYTDGLTGVYNRRYLFMKLTTEIDLFRRYGQTFSILLFDLDDFKGVNDTYGHGVGDEVLVKVAEVVRRCVREVDVVGRYGGEEFLVIFPYSNATRTWEVAERIRTTIGGLNWPRPSLRVTISGGVCEYNGVNVDAFVDAADRKLYEAKKRGKDQIIV